MKKYIKHIAIISFLAIANLLAFTCVHAQQLAKSDTWVKTWADASEIRPSATASKGTGIIKDAGELLADETTIYYLKNDAKIECDNEEIAQKLLRRYDQIIKRAAWGYKKDRHGSYKHCLIIVSKEDAEIIKLWAKNNL